MSYHSNLVALSLFNFKVVFTSEGEEYVSVLELKRKYVPDVSKSMWKSHLSRAKVNCIRADAEQTETLKNKIWYSKGRLFSSTIESCIDGFACNRCHLDWTLQFSINF